MKVLHIDSSINGGHSVSRKLTAQIIAQLKQSHPDMEVIYRDLAATPLPQQTPELHFAKLKALSDAGLAPEEISAAVTAAVAQGVTVSASTLADFGKAIEALEEFLAADVIVIGAPMYNLSIPTQLKSWIDSISVAGKTFTYTEAGVVGLVTGKKVIIASSRGGIYVPPSPRASEDHQERYLAATLGFLGINDISYVRAEGLALGPAERERALSHAVTAIADLKVA